MPNQTELLKLVPRIPYRRNLTIADEIPTEKKNSTMFINKIHSYFYRCYRNYYSHLCH